MTYRINKFDGSVLTDVVDGTIDQVTTDLTFIGSDVSGYGELLNENFLHLLESFASTQVPENPITGQIWYDLSELLVKVYNGTQFVKVAGAILEDSTVTITPKPGDLWIKQDKGQLWFHDGTGFRLAGPVYEKNQGKAGFEVKTVRGDDTADHIVLCLWCETTLIGFFSNSDFTPLGPIYTYDGLVKAGFTLIKPNVSNQTSTFNTQRVQLYDTASYTDSIIISNDNSNLSVNVPNGNIDMNGSTLKNVGLPTEIYDAVNIQFYKVYHNTTETIDANIITELEILAPVAEYIEGIEAHVYCSSIPERRKYIISSSGWTGPIA